MKIFRVQSKIVTASLSLYVDKFPYEEYPDMDTIFDVTWECLQPLHKKLKTFLTPEELKNFWKYSDTLTSDGDDHSKPKGIANLYLNGIQPEHVKMVIESAVECLNDLVGVTAKYVKSDDITNGVPRVARIYVETQQVGSGERPPHINMANVNAFFIFQKILGYSNNLWENHSFKAQELKDRCNYFLGEDSFKVNSKFDIEEHQNKVNQSFFGESEQSQEDIVEILSGQSGMSTYQDQDIRQRLIQIRDFCQWALDKGYESIYTA